MNNKFLCNLYDILYKLYPEKMENSILVKDNAMLGGNYKIVDKDVIVYNKDDIDKMYNDYKSYYQQNLEFICSFVPDYGNGFTIINNTFPNLEYDSLCELLYYDKIGKTYITINTNEKETYYDIFNKEIIMFSHKLKELGQKIRK